MGSVFVPYCGWAAWSRCLTARRNSQTHWNPSRCLSVRTRQTSAPPHRSHHPLNNNRNKNVRWEEDWCHESSYSNRKHKRVDLYRLVTTGWKQVFACYPNWLIIENYIAQVCTLLAHSAILWFWVSWPLHDSQMPLVGSSSEIQWLRLVTKKICHCPLCIHAYVCVRCFSKMYLMWILQFRYFELKHEHIGKSVHGLQHFWDLFRNSTL